MSFGSILLGALIGGAISSGSIIGITFLGIYLDWWALLLIAIGGALIGGFIAGLFAKGTGAGFLAGILSGIIVLIATFLFLYFYYKKTILDWTSTAPDVPTLVNDFLALIGMQGTNFGLVIEQWIVDNAPTMGDINNFVNTKFIYFALIGGAIFGVLCSIVSSFSGMIGGLITRKKKESYDSYY